MKHTMTYLRIIFAIQHKCEGGFAEQPAKILPAQSLRA
jgi:hypothetical protein